MKRLKNIEFTFIVLLGVIVAAFLITVLRTQTLSLGYEIAELKKQETHLRQRQLELEADMAMAKRTVREKRLAEKHADGTPYYVIPDAKRVLRVTSSEGEQP
jgi:hypothetical protein